MSEPRRSPEARPERIGRYRIREVLGTGSFATVYRATDEHLHLDVAIKVLAENHSLDPDIRARFLEEGRRLRRARNPHLVPLYDLGETDRSQPYLVLEWADRGNVATRVVGARDVGRLPRPTDVLDVTSAVTTALATLHHNHLVHRDLSPTNILISSSGLPIGPPESPDTQLDTVPVPVVQADPLSVPPRPLLAEDERLLLIDLGLSKDLAMASGLTVAAGTSGFAPPEQRAVGQSVDQRADVWAASALLVWLILGFPPDPDGTGWQGQLREAGWPELLAQALGHGLAHDPERRPPDIHTWKAMIGQALADAVPASDDRPSDGRVWSPPPSSSDRRRRRRQQVGLVAGALVAGATGALLLATILSGGSSDGPDQLTERLDNGDQQTTTSAHGITVELIGPAESPVGDLVQLEAEVSGTETWQWVGPDGSIYPNQPVIELRPDIPGQGTARLLAVDDHGRIVEATHELAVTD